MKTLRIDYQYSTGLSRHNIEQALIAAGKDLHHLQPADLGVLEDTSPRSTAKQPVGSIDSSDWTTRSPCVKETSQICPSPKPASTRSSANTSR